MIAAAFAAARQIFTRPFRLVFWKSIGLTCLLLAFLWGILEHLIVIYVHVPWTWLATLIHILTGLGLVIGAAFLVTPIAFVVAGFFFDELADHVEAEIAGPNGCGRAMPFAPAMAIGLKFGSISLLVNLAALALLVVPGVNVVALFGANAYLMGRGFFELSALRYIGIAEVRELRHTHAVRIFLAGCLPAALAMVPLANILTPLFATAFLVRVAQPLVRRALRQTD
jgi:CysZ protein